MKNYIENSFYNGITPEARVLSLVRMWSLEEKKGDKNARQWAAQKIMRYVVETADGSYTLRSQKLNDTSETMHTYHGALREAREKFVDPANLEGKKKISILDICSGLGVNTAAALEMFLDSENNHNINDMEHHQIEIDLVEISWETLAASLLIPSPSESHLFVKKAIETFLINNDFLKFPAEETEIPDNVNLHIYSQDARKMVMQIPTGKSYDAIFLDPFSTAKSPELYSYDFLLKISSLLKKEGSILTYTAAAPVRHALIDAGLEIGEGPNLGRSGGTIASFDLNKINKSLNENDERMIALSDAGIPYRDPELMDSGGEISKRRQFARIAARGKYKIASTVKSPIYLARTVDDERTEKRVLNHLKKLGITDLHSARARYLVCPQFQECICHCKEGRLEGSSARIKEMEKRLKIIIDGVIDGDFISDI